MTTEICRESRFLLEGLSVLLCDIAAQAQALSASEKIHLKQIERKALEEIRAHVRREAESVEFDFLSVPEGSDSLQAEVCSNLLKRFRIVADEIFLMGSLASVLARRSPCSGDLDDFDSLYVPLMLSRKTRRLGKILAGLECQNKSRQTICPARCTCFISSWLDQRPEVLHA